MKGFRYNIIILYLLFFFFPSNSFSQDNKADDTLGLNDLIRLSSITRDIITKNEDINLYPIQMLSNQPNYWNRCRGMPGCVNHEYEGIYAFCGPADEPITLFDPFDNEIQFLGIYGSDDRHIYYGYLPENINANSPIVILIHGGAWITGPNPEFINGFPFKFSTNNNNLVKDLLDNEYIVISALYRLAKYGNNQSQIESNTTTLEVQTDDIQALINNIITFFPSCLNVEANSIQILGESAGGTIGLQYAYTKSNPNVLKSIISLYAPTNLNQYGHYLRYERPGPFSCGSVFFPIYFPFFFPIDMTDLLTVVNTNLFNCSAFGLSGYKIFDSYKIVQSTLATFTNSPNTNLVFQSNSPYYSINSENIVPTYIMHGKQDVIVPYDKATNNFKSSLISNGGLIADFNNTSDNIPILYSGIEEIHLIKKYDNANHGFVNGNLDRVREDILIWLNGHK